MFFVVRDAKRTGLMWSLLGDIALTVAWLIAGHLSRDSVLHAASFAAMLLWFVVGPPITLACTAQSTAQAYRKKVTDFVGVCWMINAVWAVLVMTTS